MRGRLIYHRLIKPVATAYGSPHAVAMGIAIGIFQAFMPFIGLQMIFSYVLAVLLRANRVIPVAIAFVTPNTFVIAVLFWFEHFVGSLLLGCPPISVEFVEQSFSGIHWYNWWQIFNVIGLQIYGPLLLGGTLLGLAVCAPAYFSLRLMLTKSAARRKAKLADAMRGKKILLASASEARRRLLKEAGYDFVIQPVDVQERIAKNMTARKNAMRLARLKARTAARGTDADVVVAADTLTAIDGEIIGKPADVEDAKRILRMSSGKRSAVVTAVCIIDRRRNKTICRADEAIVKMRKLTGADIDRCVSSGRAMGKAGAYEILEKNDPYVKSVIGDIETVVGFPRRMFEHMLYRLMCGARFRKERRGKS